MKSAWRLVDGETWRMDSYSDSWGSDRSSSQDYAMSLLGNEVLPVLTRRIPIRCGMHRLESRSHPRLHRRGDPTLAASPWGYGDQCWETHEIGTGFRLEAHRDCSAVYQIRP